MGIGEISDPNGLNWLTIELYQENSNKKNKIHIQGYAVKEG